MKPLRNIKGTLSYKDTWWSISMEVYDFSLKKIPYEADWLIVVVGGYAGLGLIVYANRIPMVTPVVFLNIRIADIY